MVSFSDPDFFGVCIYVLEVQRGMSAVSCWPLLPQEGSAALLRILENGLQKTSYIISGMVLLPEDSVLWREVGVLQHSKVC